MACLDLRSTFKDYQDTDDKRKKLVLSGFDRHPNELANKIAADEIMEKLVISGYPEGGLSGKG